jgi:hypothetical protein
MTESSLQAARERDVADLPVVLFDPRMGDVEDDASSPKQKSLLAIAGTLLAEISLAKLLFAWTISLLLPAVLLGVAPLVATAWLAKVSRHNFATDGNRRRSGVSDRRHIGMARMAAAFSDCRG